MNQTLEISSKPEMSMIDFSGFLMILETSLLIHPSSTINDNISSARSWNENRNLPTDTIDMCQNTANTIIRALRKDNEYCEQQYDKCKDKNG